MTDDSTSGDHESESPTASTAPWPKRIALSALGGLLGGVVAGAVVIGVTSVFKAMLDVVSRQSAWAIVVVPLVGLGISALVLYGFGLGGAAQPARTPAGPPGERPRWGRAWRTFPPDVNRADLADDMVEYAGEEERFPWRLAPIRVLAIAATVGLGGPMGTEKPAAYLGVAVGAALGDRGARWRHLLRPAAVGGGAAGVSALMGIPLVGPAYVLELGHRHGAPLSPERLTAGVVGGLVGYLMNVVLGVDLFRLVVPKEPPHSLLQAASAAVLIGLLAGVVTALTGAAITRAKKWGVHPAVRLALGALALGCTAVALSVIASPSAAIGPGGGAIAWVESHAAAPVAAIFVVDLLRAMATVSAVAAGGCGGLFVPFLAVGDLAGRVFAPGLGVPGDLAGAAGAASGIAGGYGLPITAAVVVFGQGGPALATLTCLAAVVVSALVGRGTTAALSRLGGLRLPSLPKRAGQH
jgi:chloride channel protein, CIC family